MTTKIYFDTQHLYYLPQYMPVAKQLLSQGCELKFVLYAKSDQLDITQNTLRSNGYEFVVLADKKDCVNFYQNCGVDWIVFGNVPSFDVKCKAQIPAKMALMQHGIGPKACYYDVSEFPVDVRFVEGQSRLKRLQTRFPHQQFVDVGFAKLDPLFSDTQDPLKLTELGLDPNKKTLLYAPTFFPSSIERFSKDWPQLLSDYNLIIKPHFFSLTKKKYSAHRKLFDSWRQYRNVYIAEGSDFSLVPFIQAADLLLSEASSSIFEFVATNKPVVWCDFFKTRWTYGKLLSFRLNRRLDPDMEYFEKVTRRAKTPNAIKTLIEEELKNPDRLSVARQEITKELVGTTDGKCSIRIANYFLDHTPNCTKKTS